MDFVKDANVRYPKTKCDFCSQPAVAVVKGQSVCGKHRGNDSTKEASVQPEIDKDIYEIPK